MVYSESPADAGSVARGVKLFVERMAGDPLLAWAFDDVDGWFGDDRLDHLDRQNIIHNHHHHLPGHHLYHYLQCLNNKSPLPKSYSLSWD